MFLGERVNRWWLHWSMILWNQFGGFMNFLKLSAVPHTPYMDRKKLWTQKRTPQKLMKEKMRKMDNIDNKNWKNFIRGEDLQNEIKITKMTTDQLIYEFPSKPEILLEYFMSEPYCIAQHLFKTVRMTMLKRIKEASKEFDFF